MCECECCVFQLFESGENRKGGSETTSFECLRINVQQAEVSSRLSLKFQRETEVATTKSVQNMPSWVNLQQHTWLHLMFIGSHHPHMVSSNEEKKSFGMWLKALNDLNDLHNCPFGHARPDEFHLASWPYLWNTCLHFDCQLRENPVENPPSISRNVRIWPTLEPIGKTRICALNLVVKVWLHSEPGKTSDEDQFCPKIIRPSWTVNNQTVVSLPMSRRLFPIFTGSPFKDDD